MMVFVGSLTTYLSLKYSKGKNSLGDVSLQVESNQKLNSKLVSTEDVPQSSEDFYTTSEQKQTYAPDPSDSKEAEINAIEDRIKQKYNDIQSQKVVTNENLHKPKNIQSPATSANSSKSHAQKSTSNETQNTLFNENSNSNNKPILATSTTSQTSNVIDYLKREEVQFDYSTYNLYKDLYANQATEKQNFVINNLTENYIVGKHGTILIFPPNAFLNSKGILENENITITLQEFYKPHEVMLAGYYTQNNDQIFQTEGIINIEAYKEGELLQLNPAKKMLIVLNTKNQEDEYYLFNQNIDATWQQVSEQDKNLIPLPLESLGLHTVFGNTYDRTLIATQAFARRFNYYEKNAKTYQKAITGIYLASIREPLYKADELVLNYLKDVKAPSNLIHQFEQFYQEKLGQVVNIGQARYSAEISLTEQYMEYGNSTSEAERLAQYYLIRKAYQEWVRTKPHDVHFASRIYKINKLGTFASQKVLPVSNEFYSTGLQVENLNGLTTYFISPKNVFCKLPIFNNEIYINKSFTEGKIIISQNQNGNHYVLIQEAQSVIPSKPNPIHFQLIDKEEFIQKTTNM